MEMEIAFFLLIRLDGHIFYPAELGRRIRIHLNWTMGRDSITFGLEGLCEAIDTLTFSRIFIVFFYPRHYLREVQIAYRRKMYEAGSQGCRSAPSHAEGNGDEHVASSSSMPYLFLRVLHRQSRSPALGRSPVVQILEISVHESFKLHGTNITADILLSSLKIR